MPPVVIAKDLYKCYAGFAPVLRGASIEVEPGEMVAIMGPSGCGKSTMLHILGLLHAPDSGTLEILGTNPLKLDREQTAAFRRGNLGFVMQSSNLFEHSTVFENVEFPLIYENVPPQERWERVIRALDLVRLSARVHYRSNRLSGGEQQRVAIARAMVNNPRILMADEPTGALDARTSRLIMENFRTLCHSGGVAMIMVTHDPKMAEYCDSVYTLEDGVLVTKKREVPKVSSQRQHNFLNPPEPVARGALVAWRFPQKSNYALLALANRLNSLNLLSRIYAISPGALLANPEGYSLPLAVRRVSFWQNLLSFRLFFHRARKSESLWSLWRQLPAQSGLGLLSRLRAFADGAYLARWGLEDHIQYFYAASADREATAAWVAARLLRLPFIFAMSPQNLASFGANYLGKTRGCAFVVCSTNAEVAELRRLVPELALEKIVMARKALPVTPQDEDIEVSRPNQAIMPINILAPDALDHPAGLRTLLAACASMNKKKANFTLLLPGPKSMALRWKIFTLGLRGKVSFTGDVPLDRLGELFRTADIVTAVQSDSGGWGLPDYVCEAMAYATPVVACGPGPGMKEALQDNKNSLFVPESDPNALADALEKLILDSALRKKLGETAKKDIAALLDTQATNHMLADKIVAAVAISQRLKSNTGKLQSPEI